MKQTLTPVQIVVSIVAAICVAAGIGFLIVNNRPAASSPSAAPPPGMQHGQPPPPPGGMQGAQGAR